MVHSVVRACERVRLLMRPLGSAQNVLCTPRRVLVIRLQLLRRTLRRPRLRVLPAPSWSAPGPQRFTWMSLPRSSHALSSARSSHGPSSGGTRRWRVALCGTRCGINSWQLEPGLGQVACKARNELVPILLMRKTQGEKGPGHKRWHNWVRLRGLYSAYGTHHHE